MTNCSSSSVTCTWLSPLPTSVPRPRHSQPVCVCVYACVLCCCCSSSLQKDATSRQCSRYDYDAGVPVGSEVVKAGDRVLCCRRVRRHTPIIAFRHLPLNSARFDYATEGALFISAQLSTDPVSALRKVWVLI